MVKRLDEPPPELFGRYRLGPRIAQGGMGEVYLAVQLGLGSFEKVVALKLLLPQLLDDPEAVQMFLNEAALSARLSHPNIVQVLDVGLIQGRYYIAMELVQGDSLGHFLGGLKAAKERISASELCFIAHSVAQGLAAAHGHKSSSGSKQPIIHRDISPQNVLVSWTGVVQLTDFGVAKLRQSGGRGRDSRLRGKFEYFAPEQLKGFPADEASDIFGVGITLLHLATGISPFLRDSDAETLAAVQTSPIPSLSEIRPDLPMQLSKAIERAAARARGERFTNINDFRAALPPTDSSAQTALGEHARKVCGPHVKELQDYTLAMTSVRAPLRETVDGRPGSQERALAASRRKRLGIAAATVAVVGAGAALLWPSKPKPGGEVTEVPPTAVNAPVDAGAPVRPPVPDVVPPRVVEAPVVKDAGVPAEPTRPVVKTPRPKPVDARPASTEPGTLAVNAKPWGEVYLGGRKLGETPAEFRLEPGVVVLEFRNPETGRSVKKSVKIVSGKSAQLSVDLR